MIKIYDMFFKNLSVKGLERFIYITSLIVIILLFIIGNKAMFLIVIFAIVLVPMESKYMPIRIIRELEDLTMIDKLIALDIKPKSRPKTKAYLLLSEDICEFLYSYVIKTIDICKDDSIIKKYYELKNNENYNSLSLGLKYQVINYLIYDNEYAGVFKQYIKENCSSTDEKFALNSMIENVNPILLSNGYEQLNINVVKL